MSPSYAKHTLPLGKRIFVTARPRWFTPAKLKIQYSYLHSNSKQK